MGKFGGFALRGSQTLFYFIAFSCSAIILGFYSYFLSVLTDRGEGIPRWEKAVTGISGLALLYTLLAIVLTFFLGGISVFAFLGIVLNVVFTGGFVAIAALTRDGAHTCRGEALKTPLGVGDEDEGAGGFDSDNLTYKVKFGTACRFNKASFAVSIIGALTFLIATVVQFLLYRHHKHSKAAAAAAATVESNGTRPARRWPWQKKTVAPVVHKDGAVDGPV